MIKNFEILSGRLAGGVMLAGLLVAASDAATVVRVPMAAAPQMSGPAFTSTAVSPRSSVAAPPVTRTPGFITTTEPAPAVESTTAGGADEGGAESTTSSAADQPSSSTRRRSGGSSSAAVAPAPSDAKGGMPPEEIVYDDPNALQFAAEAGWSNVHLWRGIDLVQFTSYNHTVTANQLPKADSDIYWLGVTATWNGFGFGLKYVESTDDNLNPFYAPTFAARDSYSELVFTASYTAELVPEWLVGTFGFDFIYYPNGEFWGVDHQGMAYVNLKMPRYTWAQPFVDVFYNIATTEDGNGLAGSPIGGRGASASDLVEGWGVQFGVAGGDVIAQTGIVTWGFGYSISGIYKRNYAFEEDGLSHLIFGVSAPVTIGEHFTITPSVSYVEPLQDVAARGGPGVPGWPGLNPMATAWNEPGWVASVKASWAF